MKLVDLLEKLLYDIAITQGPSLYNAKMKSPCKPHKRMREYKAPNFEEILEQIVRDILDDHEE